MGESVHVKTIEKMKDNYGSWEREYEVIED